MWEKHDELIGTCHEMAQTLIAKIDKAHDRVKHEFEADKTGDQYEEIEKKRITLYTRKHLAQKALVLCEWERLQRKTNRLHSPFDTEPAIRSRYAWTLDILDQDAVSPMRVLWQLERRLNEALEKVTKM
jgi:hypothetical protein